MVKKIREEGEKWVPLPTIKSQFDIQAKRTYDKFVQEI